MYKPSAEDCPDWEGPLVRTWPPPWIGTWPDESIVYLERMIIDQHGTVGGQRVYGGIYVLICSRSRYRRRFILAAEGPIYLLLAVLDMLTHTASAFRTSLFAFKVLDMVIAAMSFLPIILFTFFLYIFKRTEVFPAFPRRFKFVANCFALVVIPCIAIANEIGSFVGNTYTVKQFNTIPPTPPQFAVGTDNDMVRTARTFFNSLALALMATYELVTFLIFFVRLSSSLVGQRDIESRNNVQNETFLFKGTGWIALGMTVATVESVIGFAEGQFGLFFTRRLLRMLGRACVIIGVVKGPDRHLQFEMMEGEKRGRRTTTLRMNISNPLLIGSSSQQRESRLIPIKTANGMSDLPVRSSNGDIIAAFPSTPGFPGASQSPFVPGIQQRVTVSRGRGRAPTLILRLSDMDLPSPATMVAEYKRRPSSFEFPRVAESGRDTPASMYSYTRDRTLSEPLIPPMPPIPSPPPAVPSKFRNSFLGRIPGRPTLRVQPDVPRAATFKSPLSVTSPESAQSPDPLEGSLLPRRTSSKRKPVPPVRASMYLQQTDHMSPISPPELSARPAAFPIAPDSAGLPWPRSGSTGSSTRLSLARDSLVLASPADSVLSGQWISSQPRKAQVQMQNIPLPPHPKLSPARVSPTEPPGQLRRQPSAGEKDERRVISTNTLDIDWISNPDIAHENEEALKRARTNSPVRPPATRRGTSMSLLGVGHAPRRLTPTPTSVAFTRTSVAVEQGELPTSPRSVVNVMRKSSRFSVGASTLARQDSGVLGPEDAEYVRRQYAGP
ncbi:hypothetical protein OF83DRAFT_365126 [Amylostereum chailletii]|nr:hypothetical protein OF83DRAFT_365126 [Amylostereum chailletii]